MADDFNIMENSLRLKGRKTLSVTGVEDVSTFDERMITAQTNMGELTVKGEELKILSLNTDTGEMSVEGENISSLVYTGTHDEGGFFKRLFK